MYTFLGSVCLPHDLNHIIVAFCSKHAGTNWLRRIWCCVTMVASIVFRLDLLLFLCRVSWRLVGLVVAYIVPFLFYFRASWAVIESPLSKSGACYEYSHLVLVSLLPIQFKC